MNRINLLGLVLAVSGSALGATDAIEPAAVQTRPTWGCMGINWPFAGDLNRNAVVEVAFRRKGTEAWREAMPLWRHEYGKTVMFSGSVLRLAPGTEYEFRLTMKDADGGGVERIVSAATLEYPRMPARTVAVQGGLAEAQAAAAPGSVMLIPAGKYPAAALTKSGKPGQWIVYRPAGDGEVIIEGTTTIRADYVWLHGLTMRCEKTTISGAGKGVCITGCRLSGHYCIHTGQAENWFISDNYLKGDAGGRFTFGGEGVDFGKEAGRCGHALCFNEMTDFADGMSYGQGNIDVYNNFIHETVDDFIEPDYSHENYRIWDNRCYNSMCGFSFQPMNGGPWYIFNNINVGAYLHALKVKDIKGPSVIYGNTILTKSSQLGQGGDILRGWILNNVWLRCTNGPLASAGRFRETFNPTLVDYNAYGTGGVEPWSGGWYKPLAQKMGWDKHSLFADYKDLFADPVVVPTGQPYYGKGIQGKLIGPDWHFNHSLLRPKEGSPLIDAGTVLPNLTGPFLGKAPDLGANEAGLGTPWYGPRTWDCKTGLVYGVPEGWKPAPAREPGPPAGAAGAAAGDLMVVLECAAPKITASLRWERHAGEARWTRAERIVADDAGAATPVLTFQDGLLLRLYIRDGAATLTAARVDPDGVLIATATCPAADLPAARLHMFQFARSLYR